LFADLTGELNINFFKQWVPIFEWLPSYQKADLRGDAIAGITVAMMLIPQAMSYALLAGLDPIIGLYASILPLVIYAIFGTSRQPAVGPVAMVALLVTSGVGAIAESGSARYIELAIMLALMVGVMQFAMGVFRLGFLTNFMSHPVISGFTSASALIIGFSQLKHIVRLPLPRTENIAETVVLAPLVMIVGEEAGVETAAPWRCSSRCVPPIRSCSPPTRSTPFSCLRGATATPTTSAPGASCRSSSWRWRWAPFGCCSFERRCPTEYLTKLFDKVFAGLPRSNRYREMYCQR
jgi:hypothetical protein